MTEGESFTSITSGQNVIYFRLYLRFIICLGVDKINRFSFLKKKIRFSYSETKIFIFL